MICKKKPEAVDEAFYKSFASILLRVMYRFCRDVNELMYMVKVQNFIAERRTDFYFARRLTSTLYL